MVSTSETIPTLADVIEEYLEGEELFASLVHELLSEEISPPIWEGLEFDSVIIGAKKASDFQLK